MYRRLQHVFSRLRFLIASRSMFLFVLQTTYLKDIFCFGRDSCTPVPRQANAILESTVTFLRIYQSLASYGVQHNLFRWKVLPKCHDLRLQVTVVLLVLADLNRGIYIISTGPAQMLRHVGENAVKYQMNPRCAHTFVDEDTIGQWKRLAQNMPRSLRGI